MVITEREIKKIIREEIDLLKEVELPKKQWLDVDVKDLTDDQIKSLWNMYTVSYAEVGLTLKDVVHMKHKYRLLWLIDIDNDNDPDAFIIYTVTPYGNKLALSGSDGTHESKSVVVAKTI